MFKMGERALMVSEAHHGTQALALEPGWLFVEQTLRVSVTKVDKLVSDWSQGLERKHVRSWKQADKNCWLTAWDYCFVKKTGLSESEWENNIFCFLFFCVFFNGLMTGSVR